MAEEHAVHLLGSEPLGQLHPDIHHVGAHHKKVLMLRNSLGQLQECLCNLVETILPVSFSMRPGELNTALGMPFGWIENAVLHLFSG
jgi:hypothetical protein